MDTFEPLVELRGEWRQAAAISIPAAAAQVAAALDRALDVLVDADQVDEESLTMAAETVCKAVIARADEVELLRRRLHRAIRDYTTVTMIDAAPMSADGGAFDSEEALAAALFASVGDAIGDEDLLVDEVTPVKAEGGRRRIDEKALKKQLSNEPGKTKRRVVSVVKLLIPLAMVAAVLIYLLGHPDLFVGTVPQGGTQPTPNTGLACPAPPDGSVRTGCFQGAKAGCPGGTSSASRCDFAFNVAGAGAITLTLRWNTSDTLKVELLSADGKTSVGAPASGADGKAILSLPNLPAANYILRVTNPAAGPNPVAFNVSTN